ncbi:hypothetical protein TWF730_006732 [Orbilia blumenaviensis]|uniref:Transcription factor TFIIIC triple barrel domain-containing protein n=1 Tax=Orbilia blumenaviensis TaxID=1796055 RepID=A0AAV9VFH7_9PEZI
MSASSSRPADRVTINSRSQPSTQVSTPHAQQEQIFDENEETESFYVLLDISGDDFAAYGKYRDGRKFRPRIGDRYYEDDASGSEAADERRRGGGGGVSDADADEEEEDREEDEPHKTQDDENTDPEQEDDNDNGNDSDSSASATSLNDGLEGKPRELSLQILDLDTRAPLVNYEGKIYTCTWKLSNGTEMIFEPPHTHDISNPDEGGAGGAGGGGEEFSSSGRKIRVNQEAGLFGTTVYRLEGWPGKLKPRGRDRQEVSTKARMFAERLDAVLEHRLKEAGRNGEDVTGVTMKKFSEGQQAPGAWRA